jgi:isovaleryl-CoA dehydrogenase
MDFDLTSEQKILKNTARAFALREIEPIAAEIDESDALPEDLFRKMGEMGFLGCTIPPEYGGAGSDYLSAVIIEEELARVSPSVALSYGAHSNLCADNLYRNGDEDQRKRYLPKLCSGEWIGALGLTEPGAGSDAVSIQTTAEKEGEDYRINGTKTFITNGPIADLVLLYAKTDKERGARGITAFLVETSFDGFSVSKELEKMGNRGSPTGELILDDCLVPKENVLGEVNGGIAIMMSGLDIERAFLSAWGVGIAQGAFDLALEYSKGRFQFGRPICDFQLIQEKLANSYARIEAARLMMYKAASLAQSSRRGGKGTEIHKMAAASLLVAGETAKIVALDAVQIHGGYGYIKELPVERFLRDSLAVSIGAGTTEIRKTVIARELLGE